MGCSDCSYVAIAVVPSLLMLLTQSEIEGSVWGGPSHSIWRARRAQIWAAEHVRQWLGKACGWWYPSNSMVAPSVVHPMQGKKRVIPKARTCQRILWRFKRHWVLIWAEVCQPVSAKVCRKVRELVLQVEAEGAFTDPWLNSGARVMDSLVADIAGKSNSCTCGRQVEWTRKTRGLAPPCHLYHLRDLTDPIGLELQERRTERLLNELVPVIHALSVLLMHTDSGKGLRLEGPRRRLSMWRRARAHEKPTATRARWSKYKKWLNELPQQWLMHTAATTRQETRKWRQNQLQQEQQHQRNMWNGALLREEPNTKGSQKQQSPEQQKQVNE